MTENGLLFSSDDGGRSFRRVDGPTGNLTRTRAGMVLTANGIGHKDERSYKLSTDGLAWQSYVVSRGE